MSDKDQQSISDSQDKPRSESQPFFRRGPLGLILGAMALVLWILNWAIEFENLLCRALGFWVPSECILVLITVVFACMAVIEQLRRCESYTLIRGSKFHWREKSLRRRLLYLALASTLLVGLGGDYWLWTTRYDLPGAETDIRIFIDRFVERGWPVLAV